MTLFTKRVLAAGALILWMGVIFAFSHQPGSGSGWQPPLWYILERKSAHVFEYTVLMLLAAFFFLSFFQTERLGRILLIAFIFTLSYGFVDEIHQAFIFGRGAKVSDALIDGLGGIIGGGIVWWYQRQSKSL